MASPPGTDEGQLIYMSVGTASLAGIVIAQPKWRARSACRDLPSDMFFSQGVLTPEEEGAAKATCGTCSVIDECLSYAIAHAVRYGVWGGLTSEERRPIRRAWLAQRAYVVNPVS